MKKLKLFLLIFLSIPVGSYFAQNYPVTYNFHSNSLKKAASETPLSNSATDIIAIGDTVWLGTGKGLSKSTDRGNSWVNLYGSELFGDDDICSIAYSNGVIWAATNTYIDNNGQTFPKGTGLKYSFDNGNSWTAVSQPLDAPGDSIITYGINRLRALPVTVAVQNLVFDIALTPRTIWVATWAGGLRKSTDFGKTWQRVVLPPDYLDSIKPTDTLHFSLQPVAGKFGPESYLNHSVFSVIATDSLTLYVGTAGGVNKSTDGGLSWRKFNHLNQLKPISGDFVTAMAYNPVTKIVYAASWKAEGATEFYGVSYTSDGGETWNTTLDGEKAHNFGVKAEDIMAATDNGLFRSSNFGSTWILPGAITDKTTGLTLKTNVFYSAASEGSDVWLGSEAGIVKLTESGGQMWQGDWKLFAVSQPLSAAGDTYAYPNPFSPDVEKVNIKYSTGGRRATVTIRIFDFGMNLVKTVIQNAERGNSIHEVSGSGTSVNGVVDYWDGCDEQGKVVPNGVYFYRVDLDQGNPVFGKIMVIM